MKMQELQGPELVDKMQEEFGYNKDECRDSAIELADTLTKIAIDSDLIIVDFHFVKLHPDLCYNMIIVILVDPYFDNDNYEDVLEAELFEIAEDIIWDEVEAISNVQVSTDGQVFELTFNSLY